MKSAGQRQEVTYLALGVAVFAIALALFVGIRSLPRKPKKAGGGAATAAAPETRPAPAGAKAAGQRDPFASQVTKEAEAGKPAPEPFRLVGLVRGKQELAVIRRGDRRYYAKLGDAVGSYTLVGIGAKQVTLAKGAERLTLALHAAETAATGE